jgi:hypothetical protein
MNPSDFEKVLKAECPAPADLDTLRAVIGIHIRNAVSVQKIMLHSFDEGLRDGTFSDYGTIECLERKRWFQAGAGYRNRFFPSLSSRYMDTR